MTRHLSEDVLIEMAEADASLGDARDARSFPPSDPRAIHLAGCARCGKVFDDARATLRHLATAEVPEPSPLFWDRLSARVHDAIASGEVGVEKSRAWRPAIGWQSVAFAGLMLALAVLVGTQIAVRHHDTPTLRASAAKNTGELAPPRTPAEAASEAAMAEVEASWQFVTDMASTADLDTATQAGGFALQPGAAERAALQLTPDEQRELVRLLQEAVERPE